MVAALNAVADAAGYGSTRAGRGIGFACCAYQKVVVAHAVEWDENAALYPVRRVVVALLSAACTQG